MYARTGVHCRFHALISTIMAMFDPQQAAALLERIRRIPIVDTLKIRIDEFGDGFCRATVPYEKRYDGIFDSFHGGLLMTVADSVACFAIMTKIGPDEPMTTTDMNIRFLAPCRSDVIADARTIKVGRTLCPVHVELFDRSDVQVAVAQVTYMRL